MAMVSPTAPSTWFKTDPLNAADRLTITAASAKPGIGGDEFFAITFVTAAGRTYRSGHGQARSHR